MEIEKLPVSEQQRVIRFVRELSRSFRRIKQSAGADGKLECSETTHRTTNVKEKRNK